MKTRGGFSSAANNPQSSSSFIAQINNGEIIDRPDIRERLNQLIISIRDCPRFIIDQYATDTFMAMRPPTQSLEVLWPFLNLRYPKMWIEFDPRANIDAIRNLFSYIPSSQKIWGGGLYLEQKRVDGPIRVNQAFLVKTQDTGEHKYITAGLPITISPEGAIIDHEEWERYVNSGQTIKTTYSYETIYRSLCKKTSDEFLPRLTTLLLLLNSRSKILKMDHDEGAYRDAATYNRNWVRHGRTPKLPMGHITLDLSRTMAKNPHLTSEEATKIMAKQLVAGHFKTRRRKDGSVSDLFWVASYTRYAGEATQTEPKRINVIRRAPEQGVGFHFDGELPTVDYTGQRPKPPK